MDGNSVRMSYDLLATVILVAFPQRALAWSKRNFFDPWGYIVSFTIKFEGKALADEGFEACEL